MKDESRRYLSFDIVDKTSQHLAVAPCKPLTSLVVPSISLLDKTCRSTCISVSDTDGSLSTPWTAETACEKSRILISYISNIRGPHSVDLDLHSSFQVEIAGQIIPACIDVYVTRSYPDESLKQGKIVVLSGCICSPDPRCPLFVLPRDLTPFSDTRILCSADGHYVEISSVSGQVDLVSPISTLLVPISIMLDNVKFFVPPYTGQRESPAIETIRPGLPNRPNLLVIDPERTSEVNNFLLVPRNEEDVDKPILIPSEFFDKSSETCTMAVACINYGGLEMLGQEAQHPQRAVVIPESFLLATPRINSDILCTMMDCPLDDSSRRLLTDLVVSKLPAVVYSRLSGESEAKCLTKISFRKSFT